MTTRKHFRCWRFIAALCGAALGAGGCATPGPLHVYSLASTSLATVKDTGPEGTIDVASFIAPNESLTGFAYDPFTDHFFLRLAWNKGIRVVDRPAHAVKREFKVAELSTVGGGDLAIRPRDGHVFALEPVESTLVEFTRLGEFVRRIALDALPRPAAGVAYDTARDRLLVLCGGEPARVTTHTLDGKLISTVTLDRKITPASLGFDAEKREFYVALEMSGPIAIFGEDGRFRRELPLRATFVDVGPRSFLRMF